MTPSPEAQNAAQYMAQHRWLKDGVAPEQVAALIDRERAALSRPRTGASTGNHARATEQNADSLPAYPVYSSKPETALVELIDGAYDIVEIWSAQSPHQQAWKHAWMAKARELGAQPSP